jgi:hypothetical protein
MSQVVDCEPFLSDYSVVFHQVFTLIDPALNTSEIKPLHLSVPRQRGAARPAAPTHPAIEKPKTEEPANQRILTQRYLASKRTDVKDSAKAPPPDLPQAFVETAQRLTAVQLMDAGLKAPIGPKPSFSQAADFWVYPLAQMPVRVDFRVDFTTVPWSFALVPDGESAPVLTAKVNGATRAAGVSITSVRQDCIIAEGRLDRGMDVVYFIATIDTEQTEACAAVFANKRLVDVVVPAIKKIAETSRMCPVPPGDFSALYQKMVQRAKEAIRLRAREPVEGDITFGGRFEVPSQSNFILYHESNPKRDLCVFGKNKDGTYVMEVGYPLAMLQAFAAAICATLPE